MNLSCLHKCNKNIIQNIFLYYKQIMMYLIPSKVFYFINK